MSALTDAGSALGKGVTDAGKGVGNAGSTVGQGIGDAGKGVADGVTGLGKGVGGAGQEAAKTVPQEAQEGAKNVSESTTTDPSQLDSQGGSSLGSGLGNVGSQMQNLVGSGFSNGFQIAGNLSRDAFDIQRNVATGVAGIGGTAIDGVVTAATTGTNAVFDPVASSLKAIEGLEGLGEGVDSINGLSTEALKGVASMTKEALEMAGKPPTFFDPDHDGVVKFADTQKGFVLLGLEEQYAKIAAYALHSAFSYPTAESWNPTSSIANSEMPIHVDRISGTRWGRNWGNFERVDWVSDADVETFFGVRERQSYAEYWKDAKSYFGTALLIFEWGTTWPFVYGPSLDAASPVTKQLGTIMRAVILPTIFKSHENAKKEGDEKSEKPDPPTSVGEAKQNNE